MEESCSAMLEKCQGTMIWCGDAKEMATTETAKKQPSEPVVACKFALSNSTMD